MFSDAEVRVLLASAGVGKTTYIKEKLVEEVERGALPKRVALVTFTTNGVKEIKSRVAQSGFKAEDFTYIKTLHSLTFGLLGLSSKNILGKEHFRRFQKLTGYYINPCKDDSEKNYETRMLDIYNMERIGGVLNSDDELLTHEVNYKRLINAYEAFKRSNNLYDYTDCLVMYMREGEVPSLDVAFIDEAQDLTDLQWKVCDKAFSTCKRVYIAGDDFQSIYEYAGASAKTLIQMARDPKNEVIKLERSYRLSDSVYKASRCIVDRICEKVDKDCKPTRSVFGEVGKLSNLQSVVDRIKDTKYTKNRRNANNYLLFRNNLFAKELVDSLLRQAVPFHSNEGFCIARDDLNLIDRYLNFRKVGFGDALKREKFMEKYSITDFNDPFYYSSLIPDEEKAVNIQGYLSKYSISELKSMADDTPMNLINTVHRVKGGEADNVYYFMDCTKKVADGYSLDSDKELKVLYVAATRARNNLYFIPSKSKYGLDKLLDFVFE